MSVSASGANRFEGRFYPLDHFDKHLCLKPPMGMFLCLMFLCRDFLLALISAATSLKGPGIDMSSLLSHQHRLILGVGMIPALLVFWAYIRRTPEIAGIARWAWKNGCVLLAAAAIIQSIPALRALGQGRTLGAGFYESPWILLLSACMLAYLFLSKRVRDAFSDFPQA
jgi:hypothetical protein